MDTEAVVRASDGVPFEDDPDRGRVIVSASDTNGQYSLVEWTVVSRPPTGSDQTREFGPHVHAAIEEVFLVRRGEIEFVIGHHVSTLRANDTVRVPAGTRHGYRNRSGSDAELLVLFCPGGFEELFVKYRSDQRAAPSEGFVAEARRRFATDFET